MQTGPWLTVVLILGTIAAPNSNHLPDPPSMRSPTGALCEHSELCMDQRTVCVEGKCVEGKCVYIPLTDSAGRQRAARILSELSGPSRIPMLINLLGDRSPQVCSYAERALVRITGRTRDNVSSSVVGPAETTCGNPRGDWQAWWDENKHHYAQR